MKRNRIIIGWSILFIGFLFTILTLDLRVKVDGFLVFVLAVSHLFVLIITREFFFPEVRYTGTSTHYYNSKPEKENGYEYMNPEDRYYPEDDSEYQDDEEDNDEEDNDEEDQEKGDALA